MKILIKLWIHTLNKNSFKADGLRLIKKLKSPEEEEIETLETNDINQTKLSRLSCQIELKQEFNNITVTMTIPRTLT